MEKGTEVKLAETSYYYKLDDRHNPKDQIGVIDSIKPNNEIWVKWWCYITKGYITNTYTKSDLVVV